MTLAPMLYRASPVDHLRTVSSPHLGSGLDKFSNPISFGSRGTSPLSSHAVSATEISRPSSTSTQGSHSTQHLQLQNSSQNISTLPQGCHSLSLPGLSALASIASAPSSQLRYVLHPSSTGSFLTFMCHPHFASPYFGPVTK